jgi:hypothetical protein
LLIFFKLSLWVSILLEASSINDLLFSIASLRRFISRFLFQHNYVCRLFPGAWVYHKRRTDLKKFFKQVHNSGIARINLYKKYPDSLKLVHLLPGVFTLGVAVLLLAALLWPVALIPLAVYALLVGTDAAVQNRSLRIGLYAVAASFTQLTGYGTGFWRAWWQRCVRGKDEFSAFSKNFYK